MNLPALEVANDVIEEVRIGKIPNLQKIQRKHGYSKQSAKAMKATRTKIYKETIDKNRESVISQLEEERQQILVRMKKTRNKAKYRDLTYSLDVVTKNHQLLTGGKTENNGIGELADTINTWINSKK
jgi:hypothetical protein